MTTANRGKRALNLDLYAKKNLPIKIGKIDLLPPKERQYILRMLIKRPFEAFALPSELQWVAPMITSARISQAKMGIEQPFCYLTVRHGIVTTETDDEWHVDGFSMQITHLPEQNYVWANVQGTEYVKQSFYIPKDFDPLVHNIHKLWPSQIRKETIKVAEDATMYCFDPYIVHRRPVVTKGTLRTFVRLSFTPIEIPDVKNTFNVLMPTNYTRDGVGEFRNQLIEYPLK